MRSEASDSLPDLLSSFLPPATPPQSPNPVSSLTSFYSNAPDPPEPARPRPNSNQTAPVRPARAPRGASVQVVDSFNTVPASSKTHTEKDISHVIGASSISWSGG